MGQRDALFHAAGQLPDVAAAVQVQLGQRGVHPLLPGPGVQRLDAGLQRIQVHALGMVLVGLAHGSGLGHALGHGLEHGVAGLKRRLLRHIANAQALRQLQQAVVELFLAGDDLEHRGLAGAIAANQAQALTGVYGETGRVKQSHVAVSQVGVGERE